MLKSMVSPSPGLPPAAAHQSGEPLSFWRGWALPLPACSSGSPPAEPLKLDSCQSPPHSHQQAPPRRPDAGCRSGRRAVRLADSRQLHSSALADAGRQPAGRQVRQLLDGGRTGHPCQAPRHAPQKSRRRGSNQAGAHLLLKGLHDCSKHAGDLAGHPLMLFSLLRGSCTLVLGRLCHLQGAQLACVHVLRAFMFCVLLWSWSCGPRVLT